MAGIEESSPAARPAPLVLRLVIEPVEPLQGTVCVAGEVDDVTFTGWVDLMAAITQARARSGA